MRREVVVGSQFSVEHKDPPVGDRVFALWAVSGELVVSGTKPGSASYIIKVLSLFLQVQYVSVVTGLLSEPNHRLSLEFRRG